MSTQTQTPPRKRPLPTRSLDLAAAHARTLLRSCGLSLEIKDRHAPPSPALEWARSGAMELTGRSNTAPRFAAGPLASAAHGAGMVLRALAPESALADLDAPALFGERAALAGLQRNGDGSVGGSARLVATRTNRLVVNLPRDEDWELMPAWLAAKSSRFAATRDWKELAWLIAEHDAETLVERGRMMGLAVALAPKVIPQPAALFSLRHGSETSPPPARRPLRLLDLSSLWAGPLATSLLAMAGVEVLKIESPTRPDGARNGPEKFFRLLNGNKQGCTLDLRQPSERAVFERLLGQADIVVESARSRGLEQLGFDAVSWVKGRKGRLWASITGYGRARQWIAFGDDAAVAAGLAWAPDAGEAGPAFCGDAIADPLTGLTLAALLLALSRSGRGGLLDLSLTDCTAHAARLSREDLTLPLDAGALGWRVLDGGIASPVEKPRARNLEGKAPALADPSDALLRHWTRAC